ncbi:hypothetical protein NDU88_002616 [Pleurodeles waltl]|uniref:Uncharacterized protein n=1 Tax=Pleurodeles waltl TaxID=8319 RepID=A0AAV7T2X7_PLEWA|nr:hypothetical protein NDU88_002616 [Pleurodeles waltl]
MPPAFRRDPGTRVHSGPAVSSLPPSAAVQANHRPSRTQHSPAARGPDTPLAGHAVRPQGSRQAPSASRGVSTCASDARGSPFKGSWAH